MRVWTTVRHAFGWHHAGPHASLHAGASTGRHPSIGHTIVGVSCRSGGQAGTSPRGCARRQSAAKWSRGTSTAPTGVPRPQRHRHSENGGVAYGFFPLIPPRHDHERLTSSQHRNKHRGCHADTLSCSMASVWLRTSLNVTAAPPRMGSLHGVPPLPPIIPDGTVTVTVCTCEEAWNQYARGNEEAPVRHDVALLHDQRCVLTRH
jgi:hypothetical protein